MPPIPHRFLATLGMTVALLACHRAPQHPNVLFITIDTFRADRVTDATPNLLGLANRGTSFRNADAAVPMTLPSHATLLSGLLPVHHGLHVNGSGVFPPNRDTLATIFQRGGYRTAAFVSAFVLDHRFGLARGFETYDDSVQRNPNEAAEALEAERRGGETVDRAIAWMNARKDERTFVWVHLYDAHAPYAPPPPLPQTYDGEIRYVDQQVGRLLDAVDLEKTIVVVVGDHGEALGEHKELTHGLLIYESTLHVPLMIAAPGMKHRDVAQPVSTANVAPTIADLAGLTLPNVDGRSLAPAVRDGATIEGAPIYAESEYPSNFHWTPLHSLRTNNVKVIRGAFGELFDVDRDPKELANAIDANRPAYHAAEDRMNAIGATAIAASRTRVDAETQAKLASLGYVAPTASASAPSEDPRTQAPLFREYEEAVGVLATDPPKAANVLKTLVAKDPSNPTFRATLARAYRMTGDMTHALPLYREAVAMTPNDPDAWYNLASALQESGNFDEAMKAIAEVMRLDPQRPDTYNIAGIIAATRGSLGTAASQFRQAIKLDPRNARAYNNLGNVLRNTSRLDDAAKAFQSALDINANYVDALNGLGTVLVQQHRPSEALQYFDRAIELFPDFYEAQINRAIALQMSGDNARAATELQQTLTRIPRGPQFENERRAAQSLIESLRHSTP